MPGGRHHPGSVAGWIHLHQGYCPLLWPFQDLKYKQLTGVRYGYYFSISYRSPFSQLFMCDEVKLADFCSMGGKNKSVYKTVCYAFMLF